MGPLPKRKFSWGRTHRRRAHDALTAISLVACDNCGHMKPHHTVCEVCGFYKGRKVVEIRTREDKPAAN
jgi:large subunit ribosomal protein L32